MICSKAVAMRRRKEAARAQGCCVICLREEAREGRVSCEPCSERAKRHVANMRNRRREQRRLRGAARSHEAAADIAMSRFSYIEAIMQFERALGETSAPEDEIRLCDKIGDALLRGARPDLATSWFERIVDRCASTDALREKLPTALRVLPHQRWLASRTAEALASCLRAREAAVEAGDVTAAQSIGLSVAGWCVRLGRYAEAERYLLEGTKSLYNAESGSKSIELQIYTLAQRAIISATKGETTVAFAEFDHAVDLSKELPDGYTSTFVWDDYANWATALGRLDIARSCRERALFVARERRISWRIPYLTLRFAAMLVTLGDYEHARDLLLDALTYDTATPVLHVLLATVGSDIALILGDHALLRRTMSDEALELAFQSQEAERIAQIVAVYSKVRIARGQLRTASKLISRGIQAINQADHAADLLALAARYGSASDALGARSLLLDRMKLPHHRVAQAYLKLWEAYDAQRRRAGTELSESAREAARLFGRLGRKHQQSEALALAGRREADVTENKPLASYLGSTLTNRERQVAELVLRGLTNRAIAQALEISEHTVETHVTSILNRLGLRSRWQLVERSHF